MAAKKHNVVFGATLKSLRKVADFSQDELADRANVDRTYISLLERGQRSPTLDITVLLCQALGISLGEFFTLVDERLAA